MARAGLVLSLLLSACVNSSSPYGSVAAGAQGAHHTGAAAVSGTQGAATAGSTGTGGASSSGSSSGGSSGQCEPISADAPLTDCPAGLLEYRTRLVEGFGSSVGPITQPLAVTDYLNPAFQANSDACGNVILCLDGGTDLALVIGTLGGGYAPTIFGDIDVTENVEQDQIVLMPTSIANSLPSVVSGFNATLPALIVVANEVDHLGDGGPLGCPIQGWTFQVFDLDGGIVDAGYNYVAGVGPSTAPSTTTDGIAVIYNIPAGVNEVTVTGFNPDAGDVDGGCPYFGQFRDLTGVTHLRGGYVSFAPYVLP